MSRITYCSLEEAWGDSFNRKDRNEQQNMNNMNNNKNNNNNNNLYIKENGEKNMNYSQQNKNNQQIYDRNKYDKLIQDSDDNRHEVINNMNKIERNYLSETNNKGTVVEYNKYRFNPKNNVKETDTNINNQYTPFQESIEKKYLQDKLNHLENEFTKYKSMVDGNSIETFNNINNNDTHNNDSNKDNDIIDLIVLIIIGLLVIFVLNSIFNIGKAIGARGRG